MNFILAGTSGYTPRPLMKGVFSSVPEQTCPGEDRTPVSETAHAITTAITEWQSTRPFLSRPEPQCEVIPEKYGVSKDKIGEQRLLGLSLLAARTGRKQTFYWWDDHVVVFAGAEDASESYDRAYKTELTEN